MAAPYGRSSGHSSSAPPKVRAPRLWGVHKRQQTVLVRIASRCYSGRDGGATARRRRSRRGRRRGTRAHSLCRARRAAGADLAGGGGHAGGDPRLRQLRRARDRRRARPGPPALREQARRVPRRPPDHAGGHLLRAGGGHAPGSRRLRARGLRQRLPRRSEGLLGGGRRGGGGHDGRARGGARARAAADALLRLRQYPCRARVRRVHPARARRRRPRPPRPARGAARGPAARARPARRRRARLRAVGRRADGRRRRHRGRPVPGR